MGTAAQSAYDGLPKKVWVDTYEFTLRVAPPDDVRLKDAEGEYDGDTDFVQQMISVRNNMAPPLLLETIEHELTHVKNWIADIGDDGADDEAIALKHGKLGSQFWINNPSFQRWYTRVCVSIRRERTRA